MNQEGHASVLIIEDFVYLAESIVDLLEIHNYRATHASTGTEGLAIAAEQQPDLILLDIRLPDMSGYDVYRQLRDTPWGKTARILILTASESIETIAQQIDVPKDRVLFKPDWSMMALGERVAQEIASN